MAKAQAFVVPADVVFQIDDDGVIIENRGDIELHTTFGRSLARIVSGEGSVTVHGNVQAGLIQAAGGVQIGGSLTAARVQAGGAVSLGGAAKVDHLQAGAGVDVAGALTAEELHAGGDVSVKGGLTAGRAQSGGSLNVQGPARARELRATGELGVKGDTAAPVIAGGGAVRLGGAVEADTIDSGGTIEIKGELRATTVRGDVVELRGGSVSAKGLQGERSVSIGDARVAVDAIVAPEVHLAPKTAGRIMVVECINELGPNAIKGGFRLSDYAEMFGDPSRFLAERGLSAPGDAPPAAAVTLSPPAPPAPLPEPEPEVIPIAAVEIEMDADPATPPPMPAPIVVEKERPAPASVFVEAVPENGHGAPEHPMHRQLADTVQKIVESYNNSELPPAVERLRGLVDARQYELIRAEITNIWSELLKFHQKKGLRIQHQVTTTFNSVNSLVKKM